MGRVCDLFGVAPRGQTVLLLEPEGGTRKGAAGAVDGDLHQAAAVVGAGRRPGGLMEKGGRGEFLFFIRVQNRV